MNPTSTLEHLSQAQVNAEFLAMTAGFDLGVEAVQAAEPQIHAARNIGAIAVTIVRSEMGTGPSALPDFAVMQPQVDESRVLVRTNVANAATDWNTYNAHRAASGVEEAEYRSLLDTTEEDNE